MCSSKQIFDDNYSAEQRLFAAVLIARGTDVDQIISDVVDELKRKGIKLAGYLQRGSANIPGCRTDFYLESVASGDSANISQSLGAGSAGCRLDSAALAEYSKNLCSEIDDYTDMLVLNRFGKGESDGHGFRIAIEKAISLEIPVLTAVHNEYIQPWREFSGDFGIEITPSREEILDWCNNILGSKINLI